MFTRVKTPEEIANIRVSGKMLAAVHALIKKEVTLGMTELDVADMAARELKAMGGKPTFLGYHGFPNVICISVNEQIVHGIPTSYEFKDGDVASFDFGVTYNGMVTDSAFTMIIGNKATQQKKDLIRYTEESMLAGIQVVRDGVRVGDISAAVEAVLNKHKYGIVRELVGHGVGHQMHEEPDIPNYGRKGTGPQLKAGMTIAIEPMANLGSEKIYADSDGWTILTADGSLSAHFEHTVLVTQDGSEILTLS